jgi:hypothetical protein
LTNVEVKKLFLIISNVYPSFEADDMKVAIWQEMLHDMPFQLALNNLRYHVQNQRFQPTIAEIRNGFNNHLRLTNLFEYDPDDEISLLLLHTSRKLGGEGLT